MDKLKELIVEQALEISRLKADVAWKTERWLSLTDKAEALEKELFELKKSIEENAVENGK
jgi:hypothetical protein